MPSFLLENQFSECVIGIDEVGRGPLAGPVVAAAVGFLEQNLDFIDTINDSKKISTKKRNLLFNQLTNNKDIIFSYSIISNQIIDKINIFAATKQAMLEAVNKITEDLRYKNNKIKILTDGKYNMLNNKFSELAIIKGDTKSYSIAAASIIAKVIRDNIMHNLNQQFPIYNWKNNAGYGTKEHINAIFTHGISKYHRKTFAPIKNMYKKTNSTL